MQMKSNSKFKKEGDFLSALRASEEGQSIERKFGKAAVKIDQLDKCPCCDRWLGHNRPPADDAPRYRGQGSLKL